MKEAHEELGGVVVHRRQARVHIGHLSEVLLLRIGRSRWIFDDAEHSRARRVDRRLTVQIAELEEVALGELRIVFTVFRHVARPELLDHLLHDEVRDVHGEHANEEVPVGLEVLADEGAHECRVNVIAELARDMLEVEAKAWNFVACRTRQTAVDERVPIFIDGKTTDPRANRVDVQKEQQDEPYPQ